MGSPLRLGWLSRMRYARTLVSLITQTLKNEENGLEALRAPRACELDPRVELLSVAFAGELALEYMIRRQALVDRIPLLTQVAYEAPLLKSTVDLCLVDAETEEVYAACELKSRGVWYLHEVIPDARKILNPAHRIRGARPDCERYCAWVVVSDDRRSDDELTKLTEDTLRGAVQNLQTLISEPIPVNQLARGEPYDDGHGHKYRWLTVILASGQLI